MTEAGTGSAGRLGDRIQLSNIITSVEEHRPL
jgi:hypothetical protein